ncbi:MAG: GtrA family protein [Solirubrobacterales bacterium]|jgi:putative flippase GtrA|nr:GtrA family protein [Solirubrobacterales bacterium]
MTEDAAVAKAPRAPATPVHRRVRAGLRVGGNWAQLVRFGLVGGSGFVVNLAVFWVLVHPAGVDYRLANVAAYLVAVSSNFTWNRLWTFRSDAAGGHAGFQAARFFAVSLVAQLVSLAVLEALVVGADVEKLPAQAIAVAAATPLNFLGNKLWSFSR